MDTEERPEDRSRLTTPDWFLKEIREGVGKGKVLEVGCGGGFFGLYFR